MSDLVERLRGMVTYNPNAGIRLIAKEALDEIERLRKECDRLVSLSREHVATARKDSYAIGVTDGAEAMCDRCIGVVDEMVADMAYKRAIKAALRALSIPDLKRGE